MSPNTHRLYAELTHGEIESDRYWYNRATPEQRKRADDIVDYWFGEKDSAEATRLSILAILERRDRRHLDKS